MNLFETAITKMLHIDLPIIQAPMAGGITSDELVATVSNHGALGMIGAGYMKAENLQQQIKHIKKKTNNPFGVNVFVPGNINPDHAATHKAKELLQTYYRTYNIAASTISPPDNVSQQETYDKQINVILEEQIPVVSFTFGVPEVKVINKFKKAGIILIGTAETVNEALMLEKAGMDLIVAQGSEAGGHRGGFEQQKTDNHIGLMSLIPQIASVVSIPVIAAGGIMDGRGLVAARALGAGGVQMGTAFLLTVESSAHPLHKRAILSSKENDTVITKAFSGKWARGLNNDFVKEMKAHEHELPMYPIMNTLTQPIRKAAKKGDNDAWMSLWSGQSTRLGKAQTVGQLIETTIKEAAAIIGLPERDG